MQSTVKKASFISGVFLALALQFPTATLAATNLGVISGTTGITENVSTGSFDNLYNFTVAARGDVAYALTSILFLSKGATISGASLYRGTSSSMAAINPANLIASATSVPFNSGDFTITTTAGDAPGLSHLDSYTLVVSGTSDSSSAYTGAITLSPVPEPETFALLSAGLGMMGFMIRRRNRSAFSNRVA